MIIQAFPSGPCVTNAYIVGCPDSKSAAIIDPAPESADRLIKHLETHHLTPDKIILTHSHWDHIGDVAPLLKKYPIPVFIHPLDQGNLESPGSDGLPCWISIEGVKATHFLNENDIIEIGLLKFHVIHTPGHTPGGICLYNEEEGVLISGDTLFKGSIGNLSFTTGQPDLMWPSLDKLAKLPSKTRVFSGHGSSTTIGAESWLPNAKRVFG